MPGGGRVEVGDSGTGSASIYLSLGAGRRLWGMPGGGWVEGFRHRECFYIPLPGWCREEVVRDAGRRLGRRLGRVIQAQGVLLSTSPWVVVPGGGWVEGFRHKECFYIPLPGLWCREEVGWGFRHKECFYIPLPGLWCREEVGWGFRHRECFYIPLPRLWCREEVG